MTKKTNSTEVSAGRYIHHCGLWRALHVSCVKCILSKSAARDGRTGSSKPHGGLVVFPLSVLWWNRQVTSGDTLVTSVYVCVCVCVCVCTRAGGRGCTDALSVVYCSVV